MNVDIQNADQLSLVGRLIFVVQVKRLSTDFNVSKQLAFVPDAAINYSSNQTQKFVPVKLPIKIEMMIRIRNQFCNGCQLA
jgi:hypothetical protein